jgi:hypothetical protein
MAKQSTICISVLLLATALNLCAAHSWVACADYIDPNADVYDDTKCRGYPRYWSNNVGSAFGVDTGFNYQMSSNTAVCRDPMSNPVTAAYTSRYPMATYSPGQTVCLAWPSKNHVAATCTNPYIPDTSLKIMLSPRNPSSDPSLEVFQQNVIADLGDHVNGVIDFKGFQHCPRFCENMDKSFCERCFTIPASTQPGNYVMLWYWIFNAGSAPYTTCMDVVIGGSSAQASAGPATTAGPTTTTTTTTTTVGPTTTAGPATTAGPTTTTGMATSGSTTGSPSPSPSPSPAPSGGSTIYDEGLALGYTTAWSWQCTTSTATGNAYSGQVSLQAAIAPWGGLQIGAAQQGVMWQGRYSKVNFAVKGNAATSQVSVWFSGGAKRHPIAVDTTWRVYSLDLQADLGAPASIFNPAGFVFFNDGPSPNTINVDSISLS